MEFEVVIFSEFRINLYIIFEMQSLQFKINLFKCKKTFVLH